MRPVAALVPLLLAPLLLAQQEPAPSPTPEALVARLGHEDYEVREEATEELIAMGEAAIPALEAALESDDLEVRLRAGRALGAIRRARVPLREERPEAGLPFRVTRVGIQSSGDGRVAVTVGGVDETGETVERTYRGESLEQLRRDHPELRDALGGIDMRWGGAGRPDPDEMLERFGFERWLEEERRRHDEFLRRWLEGNRTERRRMLERELAGGRDPGCRRLGVDAAPPDPVLDAQLQLRGRGVVIETVDPDSPAAALGLRPHDVLVALHGIEIRRVEDLSTALAAHGGDEVLRATVIRRAARVALPLANAPEPTPAPAPRDR